MVSTTPRRSCHRGWRTEERRGRGFLRGEGVFLPKSGGLLIIEGSEKSMKELTTPKGLGGQVDKC